MMFNFIGALIGILTILAITSLPGFLIAYLAYRFLLDRLTKRIDEMEERQHNRESRSKDELIAQLNDRIDRLETKLLAQEK